MTEKEFKTFEELINLLAERGMDLNGKAKRNYALKVLEKHGYYNIINGYNKLFLLDEKNSERYKKGTTIAEINALYQFDRVLRNIFFRYILEVEANVKNLVAHYFSEVHGYKNYLVYTNFNTELRDAESKITNVIAEIHYQTANRSGDPSIAHYLKNYGYIPLWVLNNILTMGTISKFYSVMMPTERQRVSESFAMTDDELENALFYISAVRNYCAHSNRIYCFSTRNTLLDTDYHVSLRIPTDKDGEYLYGKRDLFACLLALKQFLSKNDFRRMKRELFAAIKTLNKKLIILTEAEIRNEMGFPANWVDL
ncbi:MAG: Abi family protein [Lachnospiraceae bacterium]|nr:Abi family protein [Lachnospiraceae bacterium]